MIFKISRFFSAFLALLGLVFFGQVSEAVAHRINIFAYSDGQNIYVRAGFSRSQPARNAIISVSQTGQSTVLLTRKTDDNGQCSFPIPDVAQQSGLTIRVNAGEGHVNTWTMSKEEFSAKPQISPQTPSEPLKPEVSQTDTSSTQTELRRLLQTELAKQLSPIRHELAEARERIRFTDILGGIGWLVGLAGLISAVLARCKPKA